MNISIFGLGYVGCVSLGCLAQNGHRVIGVDINKTKVDFINQGKPTIIEKGIEKIIHAQHLEGNVSATRNGLEAVVSTEVSFICIGTPSTQNGHLNLDAIFHVAEEIGAAIREKNDFHVVVIRSTVMPGTNRQISDIIEKTSGKQNDVAFAVVSNPEFLREGSAVKDYYCPPYTVIGSQNEQAINKMKQIYQTIDAPIIVTDIKIAEMIKYVSNAFHALKVTFANEIGMISRQMDIDSHELMRIFCLDHKLNISPYYLKPGFCYGGSCLPKDLKALRTIAHDNYIECPVIENIERSNETLKKQVFDEIFHFNKKNVAFLGISFKSGTDDLRESPIIDIIEQMVGKGFNVKIYDKNVQLARLMGANKEYILNKIPYLSQFIIDDPAEIIDNAEAVVIVNNDNDYKNILNHMPDESIVLDLVNMDFENRENIRNYKGIAW